MQTHNYTLTLQYCSELRIRPVTVGGTAAAAPPPSGLATLPSVGAVP